MGTRPRTGSVASWRVGLLAFLAGLASVVQGEVLTVATYNVENYGPANRLTEAGYRTDYPKPEAEKQALRRVLRGLDADVVMLQEMGDARYLEELRRDLRAEGLDYPHAAVASAADADRRVAVISRRPLQAVRTHDDLVITYFGARETVKRGVLEVTLATAAGELTLFGIHLKSRFTDRPDDALSAIRRAAEATAIRDRVLQRFPTPREARFLILGDCNDGRTSKAVAFLQKRGRTEISRLLPGADSRGESWSHAYRREETYTRVDHILVSPGLATAVRDQAARIFDGEGVREASDHRPVLVTLELSGKK